MMPETIPKSGKRDRLIQAAKRLFYMGGVQHTSLAEIAQAADVPLGNVYYHFRTKDALLEAVIASHAADIHAQLSRFNADPDPRVRLLSYLRRSLPYREQLVRFGCPYATLTAELSKIGGSPAQSAAGLFGIFLTWLEGQFRDLGRADAGDLALEVLSGSQGALMLAHATGTSECLERQTANLERLLDAVYMKCD